MMDNCYSYNGDHYLMPTRSITHAVLLSALHYTLRSKISIISGIYRLSVHWHNILISAGTKYKVSILLRMIDGTKFFTAKGV